MVLVEPFHSNPLAEEPLVEQQLFHPWQICSRTTPTDARDICQTKTHLSGMWGFMGCKGFRVAPAQNFDHYYNSVTPLAG